MNVPDVQYLICVTDFLFPGRHTKREGTTWEEEEGRRGGEDEELTLSPVQVIYKATMVTNVCVYRSGSRGFLWRCVPVRRSVDIWRYEPVQAYSEGMRWSSLHKVVLVLLSLIFMTSYRVAAGRHSPGLQAANTHPEGLCSCWASGQRPLCLCCHWDRYCGYTAPNCSPSWDQMNKYEILLSSVLREDGSLHATCVGAFGVQAQDIAGDPGLGSCSH